MLEQLEVTFYRGLQDPTVAGLSHMGDEVEEGGVVPRGASAVGFDGSIAGMLSEHVESELLQQGQVLRCVFLSAAHRVSAEAQLEHPMQLVLDAPVVRATLSKRSTESWRQNRRRRVATGSA